VNTRAESVNTTKGSDVSDPDTTGAAEDGVLAAIRDMYDAFLADDRERFDSHLHGSTTTWESGLPAMYSRTELDEFRERRAATGSRPVVSEMTVEPQRIEVWGDTAVIAYLLRISTADDAYAGLARITDVMRRIDDTWVIVHHHAQDREADDAGDRATVSRI
jgi:hypothetical protein